MFPESEAAGRPDVDDVRIGPEIARARLRKSPSAFRTISEVADELHIPQHVLRFWETRFPQVKPLKRGGGRRYYRPDDISLLRSISDLLYIQGYTIKGVQRLLREGGGALPADIPPASEAERIEGEAERDRLIRESRAVAASDEPPFEPDPRPSTELLREILVELEALRAMLPDA